MEPASSGTPRTPVREHGRITSPASTHHRRATQKEENRSKQAKCRVVGHQDGGPECPAFPQKSGRPEVPRFTCGHCGMPVARCEYCHGLHSAEKRQRFERTVARCKNAMIPSKAAIQKSILDPSTTAGAESGAENMKLSLEPLSQEPSSSSPPKRILDLDDDARGAKRDAAGTSVGKRVDPGCLSNHGLDEMLDNEEALDSSWPGSLERYAATSAPVGVLDVPSIKQSLDDPTHGSGRESAAEGPSPSQPAANLSTKSPALQFESQIVSDEYDLCDPATLDMLWREEERRDPQAECYGTEEEEEREYEYDPNAECYDNREEDSTLSLSAGTAALAADVTAAAAETAAAKSEPATKKLKKRTVTETVTKANTRAARVGRRASVRSEKCTASDVGTDAVSGGGGKAKATVRDKAKAKANSKQTRPQKSRKLNFGVI